MHTLLRIKKIRFNGVMVYLFALVFLSMNGYVHASTTDIANQAQLKVTPKPCVALHKGQKCYLEVTFSWQNTQVSNYCLVNTTTNTTVKCWKQKSNGEFSFDFQSKLTNNFALRKQGSTADIAIATIPVVWVYKSSKRAKSTWRLF